MPATPFELATWSFAKVNIDYHVMVENHGYSVPYTLIHEQVDVRLTDKTVELFKAGKRVAAHVRSYQAGLFTTLDEHRPKSHQKHLQWTPGRMIEWAKNIGPECAKVVEKILHDRPHPGDGLPLVSGHHPPGQGRRPCPVGSSLSARLAFWDMLVCEHQLHFAEAVGSSTSGARAALAQPYARKPPRQPLLQLNAPPQNEHVMLYTQTVEKLHGLRLEGMVQALEEQRRQKDIVELDFEARLALLVERQCLYSENRGLALRLDNAQLKIATPAWRSGLPAFARSEASADRSIARFAVGQGPS